MSRKKLSVLSLMSAALLIFGISVSAGKCSDAHNQCLADYGRSTSFYVCMANAGCELNI